MLELISDLDDHIDSRVWHVSWSNSGKYFASCGEDKIVRIWGTHRGKSWEDANIKCIATLEDAQSRTIRSIEWSCDDLSIASASFDGTIAIWEAKSELKNSWEMIVTLEGHENEVKSVDWSRDHKWLASCGRDKSVWIWEKVDGGEFECVALLQGKNAHSQDVKFVKWHPISSILFSASYDDTVKVWKEAGDDWYCSETLTSHASTVWGIAFNATGRRMVTSSDDRSIIIWHCLDTNTFSNWCKIGSLKDLHKYAIYSLDWNTVVDYVVTAGGDNSIMILKTDNSGELLEVVRRIEEAHSGDINCIRWNPDPANSHILVSCGDDSLIKLWRLSI